MNPNSSINQNSYQDNSYRTLWGIFKTPLIWTNIFALTLIHFIALYGYLMLFYTQKKTVIWCFFFGWFAGFGITAGAHRLWCHKCYEAKLPLRIILVILYAMAGQIRLYDWVRDHRVHHKFSETDADPHNANRGFFFAHVGWLMMRKHPEVLKKGKTVDCTDILQDPVVAFFDKYILSMTLVFCFILPSAVPYYFWNERLHCCIFGTISRYATSLNLTWLVNSAAHMFGNKPYNKNIQPAENLTVSILAMGEGWHNYHHTFPWDYKAAELGNYEFNVTTLFLDIFAKIGWAYNMKTASKDVVKQAVKLYGDGTGN